MKKVAKIFLIMFIPVFSLLLIFTIRGLIKNKQEQTILNNNVTQNYSEKTSLQNNIVDNSSVSDSNTSSSDTNSDSDYSIPREPSDNDKTIAWVAAQKVVTDNLKSPSSAKFPFSYNSPNVEIKEIGVNKFKVSAYVDADNSFGAKIRNNFTVTIIKSGSSGFTYKDLNISSN